MNIGDDPVFSQNAMVYLLPVVLSCFAFIIIAVCINLVHQKQPVASIHKLLIYVYLEEYLASLSVALLLFSAFTLWVALLLWIIAFFALNFVFRKNHFVKLCCDTQKEILTYQLNKVKPACENFYQVKCFVVKKNFRFYKNSNKAILFFKYRIPFGIGLIVASIFVLLNYSVNSTFFEYSIANVTLLNTILFYLYGVAYWANVHNEYSDWFGGNVAFTLYYITQCIVFDLIVLAVTWYCT